jgi:hypothetical protein
MSKVSDTIMAGLALPLQDAVQLMAEAQVS